MADASPIIGKIYGVDIQLHWLLILFLAFLLFDSIGYFILITLLFTCVLLHELAHAITSKRNGIAVRKIFINLLLGETFIDTSNIKPNQEFYISVAGPISSILIGLVCGFFVIFMPAGFLNVIFQYLFEINLLLGVFNLLPGFPLDGGRVFRSYLQERMEKLRATRITVMLGNIIAVLIVIGTIAYVGLPILHTPSILSNGGQLLYDEFLVVFSFIMAMFMYVAGKAEMQMIYVSQYASKVGVTKAMSDNFILESPDTTLAKLYDDIVSKHTHIALFIDGNAVKVVSRIPSNLMSKEAIVSSEKPIAVWGVEIPKIQYNVSIDKAINIMRYNEATIAAVLKRDKIVGVLLEQHLESFIALHISHHRTANAQEKE